MKTYSLIISTGRCGSNYLADVINSHQSAFCYGELFHPSQGQQKEQIQDPVGWLKKFYSLSNKNVKVLCCRLITGYFQKNIELFFEDKNIKKIMLMRRDFVATAISSYVANKANAWKDYRGKIKETKVPLDYLEKKILDLKRARERYLSLLNRHQETLSIWYEDLNLREFNKVFQFLGIKEVKSFPKGTGPQRKAIRIVNRDEIESYFNCRLESKG